MQCRAQALGCVAFSSCDTWASVVAAPGLKSTGSTVVAHTLSCSMACGIFPVWVCVLSHFNRVQLFGPSLRILWTFPDQGSNLCLLHWQEDFFFTTEPPGKSPLPAFYNTNSPKFHPFLKWADSAGKTKKPETQGTEAAMQNHKVVPKPQSPTDSHPSAKRRGTQAILHPHLHSDPHFCSVNINHHFRDLSCQLGPLAIFTYCLTCK